MQNIYTETNGLSLENRRNLLDQKAIFISCVVPTHNEEANIARFIPELLAAMESRSNQVEIIVVDDGSRDNTVNVIKNAGLLSDKVKLLVFSRNFGKEKALTAGIEHCSGDVTILIDADFQHPVDVIHTFLDKWSEGFDMVYGIRNTRQNESWAKRKFTNMFYGILRYISEIKIPQDAGDFRLLDRKVVNAIKACKERSRFMKGIYAWVGFKSAPVLYKVQERAGGKSSWHFLKLTDLALTGIISFSDAPLRLVSILGLIISFISFLSAIYIIADTMIFGEDVPGYATLLTAIVFFGGIQMLCVGALGEYVARIFHEVKERPQYIVAEQHGFEEKS